MPLPPPRQEPPVDTSLSAHVLAGLRSQAAAPLPESLNPPVLPRLTLVGALPCHVGRHFPQLPNAAVGLPQKLSLTLWPHHGATLTLRLSALGD